MMKIPDPKRGLLRCLGVAAAAMLALSAIAGERAEALSLINPGVAPTAKYASDGLTIEARGGHGGGGHGGGGFHGGGFHGGGAAFHGGGFRTAHVFHGGGFRHGGFRHRHFHRHFYGSYYDDYPYYYYPHRRCRIVWTYHGARRICHHRHWRHRWSPYW